MDALDAIMTRRSIRRYSGEPVTPEQIETVLRAAQAAPSAGNQQPWRFIVITEAGDAICGRPLRAPMRACSPEAALGIVVCGDTADLKHDGHVAAGLRSRCGERAAGGPCHRARRCVARLLPEDGARRVAQGAARHPRGHVEPLAVLAIGHPAETKPPSDRYDASFVHHERW
jgi:nitroreductase